MSEAGLKPHQRRVKISEDELLAELEDLATSLGRTPTLSEMNELGEFSASTYYRHFGSWTAALETIEVSEDDTSNHSGHSQQNLIDELRRMAEILHRPPTTTEMNELGEYSASTYRRRFGSWHNALRESNLDPDIERSEGNCQLSEYTLLANLNALADEIGRSPTAEDMWHYGNHSPRTYIDRYGTWNAALRTAGLSTRRYRKDGITDRELIIELRSLAAIRNCIPQRQEMEEYGPFSGMTYYNRFGSWQNALAAAGIVNGSCGNATIQGHCNICCQSVTVPIGHTEEDGTLYCDHVCETIYHDTPIEFENDIVARLNRDEDTLERFAVLLTEQESLVPVTLLYLRHSLNLNQCNFDAAEYDSIKITKRDGIIKIEHIDELLSFHISTKSLETLTDRISPTFT